MNQVIMKFGFPSQVTSDNGAAFIAQVFKSLNKKLSVKQIITTPYHPQSNIVERQNRTINAYLRAFIEKKPQQWASLLPYYMFCYNQTIHSTTHYSPHRLVFGYDITMPAQVTKNRPVYNYDNYAEVARKELHDAWKLAKERLMDRKLVNKDNFDKKIKEKDVDPDSSFDKRFNSKGIEPGDFVLIKNQRRKGKHDMLWLGPYDIDWADEKYVTIKIKGVYRKISLDDVKKSEAWQLPSNAPERYILQIIKYLHAIEDIEERRKKKEPDKEYAE